MIDRLIAAARDLELRASDADRAITHAILAGGTSAQIEAAAAKRDQLDAERDRVLGELADALFAAGAAAQVAAYERLSSDERAIVDARLAQLYRDQPEPAPAGAWDPWTAAGLA